LTRAGRRAALLLGLCALLGLLAWLMRADPEDTAPASTIAPATHDVLQRPADEPPTALPAGAQAAQPVALKPGARVAPGDPARIAGRVLRRGDDLPLDGVEITVIADDALLREPAIVDTLRTKKGLFELPDRVVARRPHTLQFRWSPNVPFDSLGPTEPGDEASLGDSGRSASAIVHLDEVPGPLDALDVWLDTGWLVRGRVVDSDGRPVPHVRLVEPGQPRDWFGRPETDAQGRFTLGNLDPGKPLSLAFEYFTDPVEGAQFHVSPVAGGEIKDLGDFRLPFAVPISPR